MILNDTIRNLWHISRTALATKDKSRHSRMIYIQNELKIRYSNLITGMTNKEIWLTIEKETAPIIN